MRADIAEKNGTGSPDFLATESTEGTEKFMTDGLTD